MKKVRLVSLLALAAASVAGLAACNNGEAKMKVGLICLHPADSSTYDKNFVEAFKESAKKLGFNPIIRENVPEGPATSASRVCRFIIEPDDPVAFNVASERKYILPYFALSSPLTP